MYGYGGGLRLRRTASLSHPCDRRHRQQGIAATATAQAATRAHAFMAETSSVFYLRFFFSWQRRPPATHDESRGTAGPWGTGHAHAPRPQRSHLPSRPVYAQIQPPDNPPPPPPAACERLYCTYYIYTPTLRGPAEPRRWPCMPPPPSVSPRHPPGISAAPKPCLQTPSRRCIFNLPPPPPPLIQPSRAPFPWRQAQFFAFRPHGSFPPALLWKAGSPTRESQPKGVKRLTPSLTPPPGSRESRAEPQPNGTSPPPPPHHSRRPSPPTPPRRSLRGSSTAAAPQNGEPSPPDLSDNASVPHLGTAHADTGGGATGPHPLHHWRRGHRLIDRDGARPR